MKAFLLFGLFVAVLGIHPVTAQTSVLGKTWTLQRPLPTSENLRSIAVNGTTNLVSVGGHGTILTASGVSSSNPWSQMVVTGLTADLWDVAYTGSQYVVVGSAGTVLYAPGSLTATGTAPIWTAVSSPNLVATDQFNAVAVSGTTIVAAGATSSGAGVVFITTDGSNWARHVVPSSTSLKDVTFMNTVIYAVMDGALLSSSNSGATWARTSLGTTVVKSVAYATPSVGDSVLNVTGSTSWTRIGTAAIAATNIAPPNLSVLWSGDDLVGVTRTGQLWHSTNGENWQNLSNAQTTPFNRAINIGLKTFVAVGDGGAIQWFSLTDTGGVWTNLTPSGTTSIPANGVAWNEKVDSGSLCVAVGSGITWTSTDNGATWTEKLQVGLNMISVMWSGSYFVAVGNGLWVSSDGITWTSQQSPPTSGTAPSVFTVARLGGAPYAVGYNASTFKVMISAGDTQGFGWSTFKPITISGVTGSQWAVLGIAKSDAGLYVGVGWGGRVITTSSNQSTGPWAQHIVPLATGEDFTDVVWANSQFTAVTSKGGIWTSTNGSTWVKRKTASQALWCITRVKHPASGPLVGDDQFIAAGDHGLLVTSFNGLEWQEADLGTSQFTNQILWMPSSTTTAQSSKPSTTTVTTTTSYSLNTTTHVLTTTNTPSSVTTPLTEVTQVTTISTDPLIVRKLVVSSVAGTPGTANPGTPTTTTASSQLTTAPATTTSTVTTRTEDTAVPTPLTTTVTIETSHPSSVATLTAHTYSLDPTTKVLTTTTTVTTTTTPLTELTRVTTIQATTPIVSRVLLSSTPGTPQVVVGTPTTATTNRPDLSVAPVADSNTQTTRVEDTNAPTSVAGTADTGERLISAGGYGTFLASTGTAPVEPNVSFELASSAIPAWGGSVVVNVKLSAANPLPVTATFSFGGTAVASDYKHSVASVTFAAGTTTTQSVTITGVNDNIHHHNAQVVIGLAKLTGDVKVGGISTHTVTITDTVQATAVGASATPFVNVGTPVTLNSTVASPPSGTLTQQWLKNNVVIPGATQPYYLIASAALADAATYTFVSKSSVGLGQSNTVPLTVLDGADQTFTAKTGLFPTLSVRMAGPDLTQFTYQWSRTTIPPGGSTTTSDISGATGSSLVLAPGNATSGDTYKCRVTYTPTSTTLSTGSYKYVNVATQSVVSKPGVTGTSVGRMPDGHVGQSYLYSPLATNNASVWIISGLPSGLVYNTTTGVISGSPTRAGTFRVTIKASNAVNTAPSATSADLTITPLKAGALGTFVATVAADSTVNAGQGGRLDLTTTAAGSFTGKLTDSSGNFPFTGTLGGADSDLRTATVQLPTRTVNFNVSGTTGAAGGTVVVGASSAMISGLQRTAGKSHSTGYYTASFRPSLASQEGGYGFLTVGTAGTVNLVAVMPGNGAKTSISTIIGPSIASASGIPVYVPLSALSYANPGSVLGTLSLVEDSASGYANNNLTSTLQWIQTAPAASTNVVADGGRYAAPAKGKLVMNLVAGTNNAKISFLGAHLADATPADPGDLLTVTTSTFAVGSTNQSTSLGFTASSGEFSGSFEQSYGSGSPPSNRTGVFYGVLIRPGGLSVMTGAGFYFVNDVTTPSQLWYGPVSIARNP